MVSRKERETNERMSVKAQNGKFSKKARVTKILYIVKPKKIGCEKEEAIGKGNNPMRSALYTPKTICDQKT